MFTPFFYEGAICALEKLHLKIAIIITIVVSEMKLTVNVYVFKDKFISVLLQIVCLQYFDALFLVLI